VIFSWSERRSNHTGTEIRSRLNYWPAVRNIGVRPVQG